MCSVVLHTKTTIYYYKIFNTHPNTHNEQFIRIIVHTNLTTRVADELAKYIIIIMHYQPRTNQSIFYFFCMK